MDANCAGDNPAAAILCCHAQMLLADVTIIAFITAEGSKILTARQSETIGFAPLLFHIALRPDCLTFPLHVKKLLHVGGDNKELM